MATKITIGYEVRTGSKQDFYTLWKIITIDRTDEIQPGQSIFNAVGDNMFFRRYKRFIQNLAKTPDEAYEKAVSLGAKVNRSDFDFDLKTSDKARSSHK